MVSFQVLLSFEGKFQVREGSHTVTRSQYHRLRCLLTEVTSLQRQNELSARRARNVYT